MDAQDVEKPGGKLRTTILFVGAVISEPYGYIEPAIIAPIRRFVKS